MLGSKKNGGEKMLKRSTQNGGGQRAAEVATNVATGHQRVDLVSDSRAESSCH